MKKTSAGLLMYRLPASRLQVMLVHPGGPFWARKDAGAWSIPKGEYDEGEEPLAAAVREFTEETGMTPIEPFIPLGSTRQPSGKVITVWAFAGDWNPATLHSNTFTLEWPPRSGVRKEFPEVDRAAWFDLADARQNILPGQTPFLDEIAQRIVRTRGDRVTGYAQGLLFEP